MNKQKIISDIEFVYNKMIQSRFDRNLEIWPLEDYRDFISMLHNDNWDSFGKTELDKIGWIVSRYYGRGEFVSGYCPKIISYEASFEAQKSLDVISDFVSRKIEKS